MVDFDFQMHGREDLQNSLDEMTVQPLGAANDELVETAEDIKEEIEETAPVDTGQYKDSWEIIEMREDLVLLVNHADYASHLVFPNPVMKGSGKADNPSAGILHDVRSIVRDHEVEASESWADRIMGLFRI